MIKATDPDATYTISNISLEFDTVTNASLSGQIRTEYMKSSILYDRILRARNIPLNNSDTSFSVDINSPSKSLKGVLLIFTKERSATKFSLDTEEFFNPKITKVEVTVEGVPNELYAQNFWTIADNRLHGSGRRLENTSKGIRLQITKESGSVGKLSCYLYIFQDAQINISDAQFLNVVY